MSSNGCVRSAASRWQRKGSGPMRRLFLAALIAITAMTTGSGCCLFDRLFCCHRSYPMPACGNNGCPNDGCAGGCSGGCASGGCASGGCSDGGCSGGGCSSCGCAANRYGSDPSVYANAGPEGGYGAGPRTASRAPGYGAGGGGPPAGAVAAEYMGPPQGQVVYPYYTTRGPRDFLNPNPRGIGP
jgi:hypothetical protein